MTVVRYLDLVVLAIALPVFVFAGFPMLGYLTGAVCWLAQRGLQVWAERKAAAASDNPKKSVGILAGSIIGRGWLVALTIFAVGLSNNDAGLAAAVLVIALFTVYFTVNMILRPIENASKKAAL
jgi:hypothetical protein